MNGAGELNPEDLCGSSSVRYWLWATPKGWAFPNELSPINQVILWKRCEPSAENSHRSWGSRALASESDLGESPAASSTLQHGEGCGQLRCRVLSIARHCPTFPFQPFQ